MRATRASHATHPRSDGMVWRGLAHSGPFSRQEKRGGEEDFQTREQSQVALHRSAWTLHDTGAGFDAIVLLRISRPRHRAGEAQPVTWI